MSDPRIAGRLNNTIDLDTTFYNNGVPTDPYAIRRVDIYRASVKEENLVAQVIIPVPDSASYPYPLSREEDSSGTLPGVFHLLFDIPSDFSVPDIYFDVWRFIGDDPFISTGDDGTISTESTCPTDASADDPCIDLDDESLWQTQCNRFWVYSDNWYASDNLIIPRLAFEPLDKTLRKPEIRSIEVGIQPLPLYDFDYSILNIIPRLSPTIRIETENNELINDSYPATIGIRQGSYRTNPFTVQFTIDTSQFLIGTYVYRVQLTLPNGESRVSTDLRFTII